MVIPKYDIGRTVYIYKSGRLIEQVVNKIQVLITDSEFKVGYQFERSNDSALIFFLDDYFTDEKEVFKSLEDFIKLNQPKL